MRYRLDELRDEEPQGGAASTSGCRTSGSRNNLKRAMIAAEDAKFVEHEGFDWDGIQQAIEKNEKTRARRRRRLDDHAAAREEPVPVAGAQLLRKGEEAVITLMLEAMLPKRRIFEIYLNVIEWGNGVFGAEAAARHYFGVSAAELSPAQARAARGDGAESALLRAQPGRAGLQPQDRHHPRADAGGGAAVSGRSPRESRSATSELTIRRYNARRACRRRSLASPRRPCPRSSTTSRPTGREAPERVEDALADVTALLRKNRLVEGLVHEQAAHAPDAERARARRDRSSPGRTARCSSASSTGCTRPTSPTSSRRCRSTSGSTSGTWSRPSATARSCSRSPTRSASR